MLQQNMTSWTCVELVSWAGHMVCLLIFVMYLFYFLILFFYFFIYIYIYFFFKFHFYFLLQQLCALCGNLVFTDRWLYGTDRHGTAS